MPRPGPRPRGWSQQSWFKRTQAPFANEGQDARTQAKSLHLQADQMPRPGPRPQGWSQQSWFKRTQAPFANEGQDARTQAKSLHLQAQANAEARSPSTGLVTAKLVQAHPGALRK